MSKTAKSKRVLGLMCQFFWKNPILHLLKWSKFCSRSINNASQEFSLYMLDSLFGHTVQGKHQNSDGSCTLLALKNLISIAVTNFDFLWEDGLHALTPLVVFDLWCFSIGTVDTIITISMGFNHAVSMIFAPFPRRLQNDWSFMHCEPFS